MRAGLNKQPRQPSGLVNELSRSISYATLQCDNSQERHVSGKIGSWPHHRDLYKMKILRFFVAPNESNYPSTYVPHVAFLPRMPVGLGRMANCIWPRSTVWL